MSFKEAYHAMREGHAISNTKHPDSCWVWENDTMMFKSGTGINYRLQDALDIGYILDQMVEDIWFVTEDI